MALLWQAALQDYVNADRRRHPAILGEAPSSGEIERPPDELVETIYLRALLEAQSNSRYIALEQTFGRLTDELNALRTRLGGEDETCTEVPNEGAIASARDGLDFLRKSNAQPASVLPAADGGVGICFSDGDVYAHIEFTNDGEVWAMTYGGGCKPETWQLPSGGLDEGWNRIRAHLQR
jgi:hypothetical protein